MKLPQAVRLLTFGLVLLILPAALSSPSAAQIGFGIGISVRIGPPALPVYEQPVCPGDGYLWTPGYWAWDDDDGYYWVPGTWVEAPQPGLLWTPGYWGWNDGVYAWNGGYWGPQIGFYGGINYGFGYGGNGFYGGEWREGHFFYNTAVVNVNTTIIHNVYVNKTVIVNNESHVAFNGGQGGVSARPTPEQETYARQPHTPPVAAQVQHEHAASQNKALFASNNHGRPAVAATSKPGEFSGKGVVAAKAAGAPYHPPAMSPKEARASAPAAKGEAANRPAAEKASPKAAENRPAPKAGEARPAPKAAENRPAPKAAETHPAEKRAAPEKSPASRPAANHAAENRPAPKAEASHPATSRPEGSRPASEARAESKPSPAPRESAAKPNPSRASAPKESAPRPAPAKENAPRASAPHESAPRASAKPAPAPKPAPAARPAPAPKPAPRPAPAARPAPAPRASNPPKKEEERK